MHPHRGSKDKIGKRLTRGADLKAASAADEGDRVAGTACQLNSAYADFVLSIEIEVDLGRLPAIVRVSQPKASCLVRAKCQDAAADRERHGVEVTGRDGRHTVVWREATGFEPRDLLWEKQRDVVLYTGESHSMQL